MNDNIVVIDTETGGLDADQHSLLSVSVAKITDRWEKLDMRTWYIKQSQYVVTPKALAVNHLDIAQADSWTEPKVFMQELIKFLDMPESILTGTPNKRNLWRIRGKNPKFDVDFLKAFMGKQIFDSIFYHWSECVLQEWYNPLMRLKVVPNPENRTLTNLCKLMKIDVDDAQAHTADYDVELTIALGRKLTTLFDKVGALIENSKRQK